LEAICDHLEALTFGDIASNRLLINVPPGFMKSLLVDVFWPAWEWGPCNMPGGGSTYAENVRFRYLVNRCAMAVDLSALLDRSWRYPFCIPTEGVLRRRRSQGSKCNLSLRHRHFVTIRSNPGTPSGPKSRGWPRLAIVLRKLCRNSKTH